jgi:DNA-binding beta-propeller fold protein YncE
MKSRRALVAGSVVLLLVALGISERMLHESVEAQSATANQIPLFQVDPLWPKPLPNGWVIGSTIGVDVDVQGNIWIIHRPGTLVNNEKEAALNPPTASCCFPAPPVLKFNPAGDVIGHYGGPGQGYEWPEGEHGVTVDSKGNFWVGGNGAKDSQALKFSGDGKFLMQIGKAGQKGGSNDTTNLGRPAKFFVDEAANEVYIADGYLNKRVIVYDSNTGQYKRHWGAYGKPPDDTDLGPYKPDAPPPPQFRNPVHCAEISVDNLLYVCDRRNDRIQVFRKDGTFVKEAFIQKTTLASGSTWDIAFSHDPQQRFIYVPNGSDEEVYIVDRESLQVVSKFGTGGRWPGTFFGVHSIATDRAGNIYTTETYEGKRIQKFVFKGMGPARAVQNIRPTQ